MVYGQADLNLGWTDSDPAATVAANRDLFVATATGTDAFRLVTVGQFHSAITHVVGAESDPLATPKGKAVLRGDGLMTAEPGVLLGIQTADCVPVLVADTRRKVVAAFHAGWRGTLARIVEEGVAGLKRRFGSKPCDLVAAIGPCIGPCCFAIGEEVRAQFESQFACAHSFFADVHDAEPGRGTQIHMDLVEANRRQLLEAGVAAESITAVGECTSCTRLGDGRRKYFSHRAETGFTGRMMSVIGVVGIAGAGSS